MSKSLKILLIMLFTVAVSFQAMADTSIASRIIGGSEASTGEFPFQVAIAEDHGSTYSVFCGGTILSSTWILTAAHCMADYTTADSVALLRVISGTNDITDLTNYTSVSQVIVHADYGVGATYNNDIALIELASPITSAPIDYLSTTTTTFYTTGTTATVSGWGDTDAGSADVYPTFLMKVDLPVVSDATCATSYGSSLTSNMICAGLQAGGVDSCQGDSGGPLFVDNGNGTESLIGIVSFGNGCAQPDYYGVYTKVANYTSWIETNTGITIADAGAVDAPVTFTNSDTAITVIDENSTYDVDTTVITEDSGTFTDSGDTINFNAYAIGGEIESFSVANSAETLELLYTTKAKIDLTINTDGDKDVAFIVQYPSGAADDYKFIKCLANIGNLATCEAVPSSSVITNSTGKWAMIYLKNNDSYDANPYGLTSDSRAIGDDKIETTVYLARDYNTDDVIDAVTGGGGGCSATGSGSAFSYVIMMMFIMGYAFRRKLFKGLK